MNQFQIEKLRKKQGLDCCKDPVQVVGKEGVVCLHCGLVNAKAGLVRDSQEALEYDQMQSVNYDSITTREQDIEQERRVGVAQVVLEVCRRLELCHAESIAKRVEKLVQDCYQFKSRKRVGKGKFAIPKDLNVFYCACLLCVIENTGKLVGMVLRDDVIAEFTFRQEKGAKDKIRKFCATIENFELVGHREVGDVERVVAKIQLYLNQHRAPFGLHVWVVELFKNATYGVWFNGKTPSAIGGCVLYHVLLSGCKVCEEALMRGKRHPIERQAVERFLSRVRGKETLVVAELRVKFAIPQAIQVCSEVISQRHLREEAAAAGN